MSNWQPIVRLRTLPCAEEGQALAEYGPIVLSVSIVTILSLHTIAEGTKAMYIPLATLLGG